MTVCQRTAPNQNACPAGSAHPLGGVQLQLTQGDTLKIRLVNKLPPPTDAKHVADNPALIANPTNLHTHGLIVEPHRAEGPNDPYGDYVFLELRNPANSMTPPTTLAAAAHGGHGAGHPDMDVAIGAVDYAIQIPANHPSGLFWFHPHLHGVALNQVTAGLSGIITIGKPEDLCADAACASQIRAGSVRHLVLKDTQVLADTTLQDPAGAGFLRRRRPSRRRRRWASAPACAGIDADLYRGGVVPHRQRPGLSEHCRQPGRRGLADPELRRQPLLRAVAGRRTTPAQAGADAGAVDRRRHHRQPGPRAARGTGGDGRSCSAARCTRSVPAAQAGAGGPAGLCTTILNLMPSARAAGPRRAAAGAPSATFRTALYFTGGDSWPAIDLAHVTFAPGAPARLPPVAVGDQGQDALAATGALMGPAELRPRGSMSLASVDAARAAAALAGDRRRQPRQPGASRLRSPSTRR